MLHPVYLAAYIAVGLVAVLACVAASRYYQLFQREKDLNDRNRVALLQMQHEVGTFDQQFDILAKYVDWQGRIPADAFLEGVLQGFTSEVAEDLPLFPDDRVLRLRLPPLAYNCVIDRFALERTPGIAKHLARSAAEEFTSAITKSLIPQIEETIKRDMKLNG